MLEIILLIYSDNNKRNERIRVGSAWYLWETWTFNWWIFTAKNVKTIAVLPTWIEYVEWSERFYKSDTSEKSSINVKHKVVKNWKNTWKDAVIFELWDLEYGWWSNYTGKWIDIFFDVNVTGYTTEWDNIIEKYVVWDNNKQGQNEALTLWEWKVYKDDLDLDNDWNLEENFLKATNTIKFIPPREVLLKKFISTDKVSWSLNKSIDIWEDIYYKINLLNNSLRDLASVQILDVLPYVWDHDISPNELWEYLPRNSNFNVNLASSLEDISDNSEVLKKFDILYSTTEQWSNLASVRDANFVTADQIDDFSKVKNIKIQLKNWEILPSKQDVSFIIKAVNKNKSIENFKESINTSAISLNTKDFSEWNKAIAINSKYKIEWKIFFDKNKDWNIDEDEKVLPWYTIQLMNQDNTPAIDKESNQPITTISREDWFYSFDVYKRWNYYIKISKKNNREEISPVLNTEVWEGNDWIVDPNNENSFITKVFTLDPSNIISYDEPFQKGSSLYAKRNFWIIPGVGTIKIKKIDAENNEIKLEWAIFEIKNQNDEIVSTVTTNQEWEWVSNELWLGEEYKVIETKAPTWYVLDSNPKTVNLELENAEVSFTNTKIKGSVNLEKVSESSNERLNWAVFSLFQNNEEKYTATSDENWLVKFVNVLFWNYILKETKAPKNYDISDKTIDVNLETNWQIIDLWKFFNTISWGTPGWYTPPKEDPRVNPEPKTPGEPVNPEPKPEEPKVTPPTPEVPSKPNKPVTPTTPIVSEVPKTPDLPKDFEPIAPIEIKKPEKKEEIKKEEKKQEVWNKIRKYGKKLPKTGAISSQEIYKKVWLVWEWVRRIVETRLPNKEIFRLAGNTNTELSHWLEVLPKEDRNKNKYVVIPSSWLVMPINEVKENSKEYNNFINGWEEDFHEILKTGSVEIPWTSLNGYGETWNKVIAWHSSYFKNSTARYKTHFQKIIWMEKNEEIWIYEKNAEWKYTRYVYKVRASYNTKDTDIEVIKPTESSVLTLFTCTPIWGVAGRWIVKADFSYKN